MTPAEFHAFMTRLGYVLVGTTYVSRSLIDATQPARTQNQNERL